MKVSTQLKEAVRHMEETLPEVVYLVRETEEFTTHYSVGKDNGVDTLTQTKVWGIESNRDSAIQLIKSQFASWGNPEKEILEDVVVLYQDDDGDYSSSHIIRVDQLNRKEFMNLLIKSEFVEFLSSAE